MKDYHINVFYSVEDGGYIADIPDLKFCSAFGETPEEAVREVVQAREAWIEAARCWQTGSAPALSASHLSYRVIDRVVMKLADDREGINQ